MNGCQAMVIELPGYVAGKLDAATAAAVWSHLETCAACQAEVRALEGLERLLAAGLESIEPSPTLASRFANRLAAEMRAETEHRERRSWLSRLAQPWLIPLGAAAALGAILFSSWHPAGEGPSIAPLTVAKNQAAEERAADGGAVPAAVGAAASEPPADLKRRPELFVDYAVIRDLDVLESSGEPEGGKAG